jgi:hypothetical protein
MGRIVVRHDTISLALLYAYLRVDSREDILMASLHRAAYGLKLSYHRSDEK